MTTASYRIFADQLDSVIARVAKLNVRAARLGVAPIHVTVGEIQQVRHTVTTEDGVEQYVRTYRHITVQGEAPKLAGWTFVATLAPTSEGTIVAGVPGQVIPLHYRNTDFRCDHCGTRRNRRLVYVVRHDDGQFAQVGSSCLRDFLGHTDPHAIAEWAGMLYALDQFIRDAGVGEGREALAWGAHYIVTLAAYLARTSGFMSRRRAQEIEDETGKVVATTAQELKGLFLCAHPAAQRDRDDYRRQHGPVTQQDRDAAHAALAWARALTDEQVDAEAGDYLSNLRVVARLDVVEPRTLGLAASLPTAHLRAQNALRQRKERATLAHVGSVGQRDEFTVRVERHIPLGVSAYGGDTIHLVKMTDADGNELVWKTTRSPLADGTTVRIRATVKAHETYRGGAQTVVNRVSLLQENGDHDVAR